MWCVWHDMWAGTFEFICGRRRSLELLNGGMTKINGRTCRVQVVGEWPELDAIQLRVTAPAEPRADRWQAAA